MKTHRRASSLALIGVVLLTTSGCPFGEAKVLADDVARDLAVAGHGSDELAADIRAANGSEIDSGLANALRDSDAIDELLNGSKEAVGLACDAWDLGLKAVAQDVLISLGTIVEANDMLDKMWDESSDAEKERAIDGACTWESLLP